jgi:hypothetical protein
MIAKIPYRWKKEQKKAFKEQEVFPVEGLQVVDKTQMVYQVYLQEKLDYMKDIRLGNPSLGIVIDGVFMKFGVYEDWLHRWERVTDKFAQVDAGALFSEIQESVKDYELVDYKEFDNQ